MQQEGHPIGYIDPKNICLDGVDDGAEGCAGEEAEVLINFMLEPGDFVAVAEGQNYPPPLDPSKVEDDREDRSASLLIRRALSNLTFADPEYWNSHETEWKRAWSRIERGA